MTGYWWECPNCGVQRKENLKEIVNFLWNLAENSDWNQNDLVTECAQCHQKQARLTYEFPSKQSKETLIVVHIVGIVQPNYLPMMWEAIPASQPAKRWFDCKYVGGRNSRNAAFGLDRPAVFERDDLRRLFALYCEKTGNAPPFP